MKYELIMFNMSAYREWEQGVANRNYYFFRYFLRQKNIKRIILVDFLPLTFKRALRNYGENILSSRKGELVYRDLTTRCVRRESQGREFYVFSTIDSIFSSQKLPTKKSKLASSSRIIKKMNKIFEKNLLN